MEVQRAEETYHLENLDELSIYKGTEKGCLALLLGTLPCTKEVLKQ